MINAFLHLRWLSAHLGVGQNISIIFVLSVSKNCTSRAYTFRSPIYFRLVRFLTDLGLKAIIKYNTKFLFFCYSSTHNLNHSFFAGLCFRSESYIRKRKKKKFHLFYECRVGGVTTIKLKYAGDDSGGKNKYIS